MVKKSSSSLSSSDNPEGAKPDTISTSAASTTSSDMPRIGEAKSKKKKNKKKTEKVKDIIQQDTQTLNTEVDLKPDDAQNTQTNEINSKRPLETDNDVVIKAPRKKSKPSKTATKVSSTEPSTTTTSSISDDSVPSVSEIGSVLDLNAEEFVHKLKTLSSTSVRDLIEHISNSLKTSPNSTGDLKFDDGIKMFLTALSIPLSAIFSAAIKDFSAAATFVQLNPISEEKSVPASKAPSEAAAEPVPIKAAKKRKAKAKGAPVASSADTSSPLNSEANAETEAPASEVEAGNEENIPPQTDNDVNPPSPSPIKPFKKKRSNKVAVPETVNSNIADQIDSADTSDHVKAGPVKPSKMRKLAKPRAVKAD